MYCSHSRDDSSRVQIECGNSSVQVPTVVHVRYSIGVMFRALDVEESGSVQ